MSDFLQRTRPAGYLVLRCCAASAVPRCQLILLAKPAVVVSCRSLFFVASFNDQITFSDRNLRQVRAAPLGSRCERIYFFGQRVWDAIWRAVEKIECCILGLNKLCFLFVILFFRRDALKEQFGKNQTRSDAWPWKVLCSEHDILAKEKKLRCKI